MMAGPRACAVTVGVTASIFPSAPHCAFPHLQVVHVRQPGSLETRQRNVRQLSGELDTEFGVACDGGLGVMFRVL